MQKKTILFLFLLLALPIAIFAFLRVFGKNRFDLPVMYQDATEWPADCAAPEQWPFKVNAALIPGESAQPLLVIFAPLPPESAERLPIEVDTAGIRIISGDNPCRFGASVADAAILMDTARLIRGVYKTLDRDEMDRLIMETKILLNDY